MNTLQRPLHRGHIVLSLKLRQAGLDSLGNLFRESKSEWATHKLLPYQKIIPEQYRRLSKQLIYVGKNNLQRNLNPQRTHAEVTVSLSKYKMFFHTWKNGSAVALVRLRKQAATLFFLRLLIKRHDYLKSRIEYQQESLSATITGNTGID